MSKPEHSSRVTLEDLLRLKRAEKPGPEFWVNFEQELRQKQLTALVQKRRWWHEVPVLLNRRLYLPAGAAAIVAFTLVTVRYSTPVAQVVNTAPQIAAADPAVETLASTEVTGLDQEQSRIDREPASVVQAAAPAPVMQVASVEDREASPLPASRELQSPPARSLIANLARLEQTETDLDNSVIGSRLSSPVRVQAAVMSQSELAPVANAAPSKYRLIARYVDRALSPEPAAPASIRERLARRLGDDLGDDISRIGVVGSRVSLKF
jgi:hypothetical protein